MIRSESLVEAPGRCQPAIRQIEEQVVDASHVVGRAPILLDEARRPRPGADVRVLVGTALDGVEVAAEHGAGRCASSRDSGRAQVIDHRADLSAPRVPEDPERRRRAERLEVNVDEVQAFDAARGADVDGRTERDASLPLERKFERGRIEQRLARHDAVPTVFLQLWAVAHRRDVQDRQSEARGVSRGVRRVGIAGFDRVCASHVAGDTSGPRCRGETAPGRAARNAGPAGRR